MELPVIIESLPNGRGFTAHLASPIDLSSQAATAEEAHRLLAELLNRRLQQGAELRSLTVAVGGGVRPGGGCLPNDDLTRDWLEQVRQFRQECDAADRLEITEAREGPV